MSFLFNIARDRLGKTNQHCDTKILRLLQKPVWFQLLQNVGILSTMTTLKPSAQNDRFVFPLLEKNTSYVIIGKQIFCICRKQSCKGGGGVFAPLANLLFIRFWLSTLSRNCNTVFNAIDVPNDIIAFLN